MLHKDNAFVLIHRGFLSWFFLLLRTSRAFSTSFFPTSHKKTRCQILSNRVLPGILATLFNVGCNSRKSTHDPYINLQKFRGGLLPLKQKNLSQRRGLIPFVISTSWSLAGWLWHLAEQVAGRSSGQFPRASLHGYLSSKPYSNIKYLTCQKNRHQSDKGLPKDHQGLTHFCHTIIASRGFFYLLCLRKMRAVSS